MINTLSKRIISRILIITLTLSIIFSTLTSCGLFEYVAESKEEIALNIEQSEENSLYRYVADYLREWGFPSFDTIKFKYMEQLAQSVYNYGDGLPSLYSHALNTANLFIEQLYDRLDLKDTVLVTEALLNCYAYVVDDPYTIYRSPEETEIYETDMSGTFGGIGVTVKQDSTTLTLTISSILPDSPAEKGGLQVGDIIYAINGKTVEELGYDKAGDYIKGDVGTEIQITVIRNEEYFTHTITRGQIIVTTVTYEIDPESKIGYIAISGFKRNTPEQFKQAVDYMEKNNAVGIIFDLRNNLGGYVSAVTDMISYLLPSGNTVVSYQYKGESPTVLKTEDDGFNEDNVVDLPFVVISNKYTASASEIFTAAIRDYRNSGLVDATIVGTTTYGKGIIQNRYYYFDGSSLTMTIAYYYTPAKVNFHGTGITPDVIIDNGESDIDLQRNAAYVEMQKLLNAN